ncbi:MAG: NAD(P)H-hydrate dehydratase [Crocinitomicaceae bacterium]|nr:NAD(P)H-hydrate dehydratase [Crocinitomicaceae bacterium]
MNRFSETGTHLYYNTFPSEELYFNITGSPGMTAGGSGDELTGIITSLLA